MKATLRSRLERLEAKTEAMTPRYFRYGWLKRLPNDYVGERHIAIVTREPTTSPYREWCEYEERAGPAPAADSDNGFVVYLTREQSGS